MPNGAGLPPTHKSVGGRKALSSRSASLSGLSWCFLGAQEVWSTSKSAQSLAKATMNAVLAHLSLSDTGQVLLVGIGHHGCGHSFGFGQ